MFPANKTTPLPSSSSQDHWGYLTFKVSQLSLSAKTRTESYRMYSIIRLSWDVDADMEIEEPFANIFIWLSGNRAGTTTVGDHIYIENLNWLDVFELLRKGDKDLQDGATTLFGYKIDLSTLVERRMLNTENLEKVALTAEIPGVDYKDVTAKKFNWQIICEWWLFKHPGGKDMPWLRKRCHLLKDSEGNVINFAKKQANVVYS